MDFKTATSRSDILNLILEMLKPHQHLLAVSKLQPVEKIKLLNESGQLHFAENYIQEALQKIELLKSLKLEWHLIGPIQKNKVKFLKNNFAYIHSIDSLDLAKLVSQKALEINYIQKVFLQINLSEEVSKSGFSASELKQKWIELIALPGIKIIGLMTMPPLENEPEKNRKYFAQLKNIGHQYGISEFSMGTSQDYQIALEEGATWIRIGTVLFGERDLKTQKESRLS